MSTITDHPLRYALANELHARPFPSIEPPGHVAYLAIKPPKDAARRDREKDRAHLIALLDRHGAPHPQPGATHYSGKLGRYWLKWESHTEFVTYTAYARGRVTRAFDPAVFDVFPDDWLADAPGVRITSILLHIEPMPTLAEIETRLDSWFVRESLAASSVLEGAAVIAGDFRIDPAGHMRFALFPAEGTGPNRVGRIAQRICEIETYKAMAMLGFARAREVSPELGQIAARMSELVSAMNTPDARPEPILQELLTIAGALEKLEALTSFRFGATGAYEAIVNQRIEVLREARFAGRQTFGEFMMRRFDPAMRTVRSTESRLAKVTDRALRASNLLRTQVDVARSAQNQALLASMDRRADLQLRLQQTVEGLSVVAISYYAVNLAVYAAYPVIDWLEMSKGMATALLTLPIVAIVWAVVRRIRKGMGH